MNGSSTYRSCGHACAFIGTVLLAWATAFVPAVAALDADRSLSQYMRDRWVTESGFPGGPVHAITQTSDGYLWIGAEKGLVRFDGLTFRLFDPRTTANVPPAVLGVMAVADGSVWARLRGIALARYHKGTIESLLPQLGAPESVVTVMQRGQHDAVLLATLGQGALVYRSGRFTSLVSREALPSSSFVVSLAESTMGETWLGTRDAGLLRVQGTDVRRVTEGLPDLKINCLLAGPDGEMWIGTDRGVVRWDGTSVTRAGVPSGLRDVSAVHMIRDRHSTVWIAAGARGLLRVGTDGTITSSSQAGWSLGHVTTVFEDRDGNLWIGTDRGLERWRDPVFTTYSVAQGLPSDAIGPIYPDEAGRVWFGPAAGGLYWLRNGVIRPVRQAGLADDVVYSIHGGDGEVWVARQQGGLTRLRVTGNTVQADRFTRADGLTQDSVFAVHRTRNGAVWAGTLTGGASVVRDGVFATYDRTNGLPSNTVAAILESSDGTVWFGTPNGVTAFSRGGWRTYTAADGLPSNDVNALFADAAGVLWIGTARGIAVVQNGSLTRVRDVAPELRGSILGFAEDRYGALWINAAERVLRVNREALLHGVLQAGDIREFGVADGLLGVESAKRHGIVTADSVGRIWFALSRGLSVADPGRADARGLPALTQIEAITVDGASFQVADQVRIPSSRRRIVFGYKSLSLSVPERIRYRYRLDGFDANWSEPVAATQAVYTNLSPGRYRFRVLASNSEGAWNAAEVSLPVEIQPMWWQTAWFQFSAVVLVALSGWGAYRLRLRQVARQLNVRFEERLAERTRIAQELHDTLLQGFVSASMQLHVAVDGMPDSPAKSSLGRVLDLTRRVIDEARHAVRGLRASSGTPHELEQAFAGVQQELANSDAAYRVIVEGHPRSLQPIVRDEVYRICREALVNAFRHSGATSIEIEIEYGARELTVFVRDDGRGIDADVISRGSDGHWGLTGMRERASRIGAMLRIRSRAAAGTEVELRLPADVAFERQPSAPRRTWPWRRADTQHSAPHTERLEHQRHG